MADKQIAREALKATHLIGLSQGEGEARARELLADAFDDIGPTGYARHIRGGRHDPWFWEPAALRAIDAALSGLSLPGRDADAREALGDQTQSVQLAEVSPPISGDAASDMLILSHARMRCALEGIREHVAHGRLGDWSIALTEIKKLVDGALGQHPTPEQGK